LLARHLGARVGPDEQGYHEIGYYPVRATRDGEGLFAAEQCFYQWHGEGFELPSGARLLAEGGRFPNQAIQYRQAYGIQFHPEVTREMMQLWTRKAAHRMVLPGAQARDAHLAGHQRYDQDVERWVTAFFARWLGMREGRGLDEATPVLAAAE
jgi:GMP synthase (glutamine-hydrolysing)